MRHIKCYGGEEGEESPHYYFCMLCHHTIPSKSKEKAKIVGVVLVQADVNKANDECFITEHYHKEISKCNVGW